MTCFLRPKGASNFQNLMTIWQHYSGQVQEGNVRITLVDISHLCFVSILITSTVQHLCAMLIFKGGRLSHSMRVACQTLSVSFSHRSGSVNRSPPFYLFIYLFIFIKLQLFVLKAHTPGPSCSTNDSTIYWLNQYLMAMGFG